jgi:hypothetical protein
MSTLTTSPAWQALEKHQQEIANIHCGISLRKLLSVLINAPCAGLTRPFSPAPMQVMRPVCL